MLWRKNVFVLCLLAYSGHEDHAWFLETFHLLSEIEHEILT